LTPRYDIVQRGAIEGTTLHICGRCFNSEVAEANSIEWQHLELEPIRLVDCSGQAHLFHFRTRLFGPGVAITAFEIRNGQPAGYQFQTIGDPAADLTQLANRLVLKISRALSVKHLKPGPHGFAIADHRLVRGTIGWDSAEDGQLPLLTIDGHELTWLELGRMLMTFEGWQFRMEIRDLSDEV
jgi:hypothetical protein